MRFLIVFSGLVSAVACAGAPKSDPQIADESREAPPAPVDTVPSGSCKVMAGGKCFAVASDACASLACPATRCEVSYSAPPEATCRPSP